MENDDLNAIISEKDKEIKSLNEKINELKKEINFTKTTLTQTQLVTITSLRFTPLEMQ